MLKRSLFFLVTIALLSAGGYYGWGRLRETVKVDPPQLVTVKRGLFVHEVLERGSIDSAQNTEVKCLVESYAAGNNLVIVSVVPEGTLVEAGDLLVELDSSTLRDSLQNQETSVIAAETQLAQSEASLRSSEIALEEYLQGVYIQEEIDIQNRLFAAKEQVKTLENNLAHDQRLLERGHITQAYVDASLLELDKAKNTQKSEEVKLNVLQTLTKERRVVQLETAILSDKAQVAQDIRNLGFRETRLKYLQDQYEKCKIYAPRSGQVVYFMPRWGNDDNLIREGLRVIERQTLIQLPDPTRMLVKGLVNEANVRLVEPGQRATIRLEAFPNMVLDGVVKTVSDFPEQAGFMGGASMSKEYLTQVTVLNPPEGIKTGLTAEARIVVNEIPDSLLLPMQAVFEYGGKMYAITFKDGKWDKLEIKMGPANDKEVVILEGLNEGDEVVMGAWAHRVNIDLPRLEQSAQRHESDMDEETLREMMRRETESQQQERQAEGGGRRPGGGGGPPGGGGGPPGGGGGPPGGGGGPPGGGGGGPRQ